MIKEYKRGGIVSMDVSSDYIKMCDCEEIQEHEKKPLDWSGIQDHYYKGIYHYGILTDGSYTYWTGSHFVWLPRQDQLQLLSGLSWQEFDKECLKYDVDTKEQAGIQVVMRRLAKTTQ